MNGFLGVNLIKNWVIWLTGHSGAGKSTLAKSLEEHFRSMNHRVIRLDSDTLPPSIIKPQAQTWQKKQHLKLENLVFLAKSFYQCETTVVIACVGRFHKWRDQLREEIPDFLEVYLRCPLHVRLSRDLTGKYERNQEYFHFYEEPSRPDLIIDTDRLSPQESLDLISSELYRRESP
ncbi:adenylyl-sulfate kinase [Kroppenstedtia eburnea]|uniref:Adenylylsulfate kinase n=1 Tax=Kroppenstedtia eburnea TaxID=714067 RepID=A0A1N7LDL2_9BACL|nr:adenylyl-sulfate kinase [Kroppenstedtia eburnea]EGK07647.1 adenylyl-sulfate kinase [Desmospora sp. 8437]QKI81400.1 adenylyl-sulfate kinase [Kroppenstedtia eburnea]SIS71850.1 adenylylsulfate kinase [Kroppenstedtia eburnea]